MSTNEDEPFLFQVPDDAFEDADGDTLTYNAMASNAAPLPAWLSFDPETRTFSGTPANEDMGSFSVTVTATDPFGAIAEQSFVLNVENVNDVPIVVNPLTEQPATEDQPFTFQVPSDTFTDVDAGDVLTYGASLANGDPLPAWLNFNTDTRTFSGTPANEDVDAISVKVTATDLAGASVDNTFNLAIANVNDAPIAVVPVADQSATEDQSFTFLVPADTFKDIDAGDQLTYNAAQSNGDPLPAWLSFDAVTGTFSGIPGTDNLGKLAVQVTATDIAGASASSGFTINIVGDEVVNHPPVALPDYVQMVEDQCRPVHGNVIANDYDVDAGTKLKVESPGRSRGTYGSLALSASGEYTYVLRNATSTVQSLGRTDQVSDHFDYTVTDGNVGTISSLDVLISGKNDAPVVANRLDDRNVAANKNFTFTLPEDSFIDVDQGDTLDYTARLADGSQLPDWLKFDSSTGTISGKAQKNTKSLDIRITATDRVAATDSTEGSLSTSDVFRLSFNSGKNDKDCQNDRDWPEKDDWPFKNPKHHNTGHLNEMGKGQQGDWKPSVCSPGNDQDSHRETHAGKSFLDAEQLDLHLRDFERKSGNSSTETDFSACWRMVNQALANDLQNFDEDTRLHKKQAANITLFGNNGDGMGSFHASGVDSFALASGSGANLKGFKGLHEGMSKLG